MTDLWILILIFSNMCTVQNGRCWVTAQSLTESPVDQPHKELSVNIGDSATLQCCVLDKEVGIIAWFKQPNRKKPQIIVSVFKSSGAVFHNGFRKPCFRIERASNCCNMTILNITQSDEAMYYCAVTRLNLVFGDGTYLKIKGEHVTIASETSKPSVVCETKLHGNNTNINTLDKTESEMIRSLHLKVLGLGTALGLCALLIFCLTYFILRRRKYRNSRSNTSIEYSPGTRQAQESEAEGLNYAALQFSKRKAKAEKRKTVSSEECVYSDVKKTVR
ncbi:uncharacterized protein LOC131358170 isoform X1 [Hemibagrus wyckioides]|uniref:uncharacterized protein LOC131358170 isoform X1 n=1 Tax=Hemibagrus wyckioides TaxID=337641 RepID=UPI00266BC333|nr:uncharacterized protein LOC131358170 isoform X1 [Hemibagrus wyckioides]